MTINLAVTDRRSSLKYKNQTQTWDWLEARCQSPIRTTETEEEYPKLPKTKQAELKDQGGFVPGILRNGSRKIENVAALSFGMLDGDHIPSGVCFTDSVLSALPNNLWFAHTTHSHTQASQRYRLAVAFSRNVQPDEYPPLMRKIAEKIGMDFFDPCSFEINRMMYWPSCPANGVFDFQKNDGEPVNVEAILAEYEDWRDVSRWPVSVRQSEVITRSLKQQQDPLTKKGVIGAFCRAYSAQDAIDTFLSDVYEPSIMSGRYDYIPADSASGVVIYDRKYVFSHHASDPACGKLLNTFDLVRVHKFGSADDKASFSAMSDFAVKDQRVNLMITDERLDQAKQDFTNDDDWKTHLERMPRSTLLANSLKNILLILTYDEALQGIRYNLLCHQIYVKGALPWERDTPSWRDADTAQLVAYVDANYGTFSARNYELAMAKVTDDRKYNPICDYLNSLPLWDGVQRVDTLLVDYLNAPDTPYVRAVTRKTLAAAVARVFVPGIKYDSMLVMDGPQEKGKSTLFNRLTGDAWYNDGLTLVDMQDKAGAEKMQGYWIMEIAELAGMKKSDIDCVKAFLSRRYDKYRPSYGRTVEDHPRQTIIVATVNGMGGYLRDPTGNRRF
ncbi:hypothetical protein FACS18948_4540 [Clostridia bacterium]|nr:hypothetical protein FACS18948_4540 [Clostridia bacterium]